MHDVGMFEHVMDWLEAEPDQKSGGFAEDDIRISVAALFYHMIAVDGVVKDEEQERLGTLLRERFHLNKKQIMGLAQEGEAMNRSSAGLFPFTVVLNRELDDDERKKVLDQLEILALADGELHSLERDMLEHMRILLKL